MRISWVGCIEGKPVTKTEFEKMKSNLEEVVKIAAPGRDIRLAAVLAVGFIDRYILAFIKPKLPGLSSKLSDRLFGRALQHIAPRIDLAQALGVFDQSLAKELHILVKVRNRFAHHIEATDCTDPVVKKLIDDSSLVAKAKKETSGAKRLNEDELLRTLILGILPAIAMVLSSDANAN